MATLQTLDRGIKALFLIGGSEAGASVADLAAKLAIDRAIAYRIVSTLEANGLVSRHRNGRLFLGAAVLGLESQFLPQFRHLANSKLDELARAANATAFLSFAEGDECVAAVVCEPETGLLRVSYQVGSRHPLNRGAAGIAILSGRRKSPTDTEEVMMARKMGYSVTRGALQKGAVGVACPLHGIRKSGRALECSIGVVAMEDLDVEHTATLLMKFAKELNAKLDTETLGNGN